MKVMDNAGNIVEELNDEQLFEQHRAFWEEMGRRFAEAILGERRKRIARAQSQPKSARARAKDKTRRKMAKQSKRINRR